MLLLSIEEQNESNTITCIFFPLVTKETKILVKTLKENIVSNPFYVKLKLHVNSQSYCHVRECLKNVSNGSDFYKKEKINRHESAASSLALPFALK